MGQEKDAENERQSGWFLSVGREGGSTERWWVCEG